ncbi:MAG: hypothetical protein H7844_01095 [Nitrospirae bacterium YQR-1]
MIFEKIKSGEVLVAKRSGNTVYNLKGYNLSISREGGATSGKTLKENSFYRAGN